MKSYLSTLLEVAGATAVTAGIYEAFGPGAGLIAGGALAVAFGIAYDGPIRRRKR